MVNPVPVVMRVGSEKVPVFIVASETVSVVFGKAFNVVSHVYSLLAQSQKL
jgi:hypothetical protein